MTATGGKWPFSRLSRQYGLLIKADTDLTE